MEHSVMNDQENTYWNLLKGLSREMKLRLIKRLTDSLSTTSSDSTDKTANKYYGAWKDDKSADELANEIKRGRKLGTRTLTSFDE